MSGNSGSQGGDELGSVQEDEPLLVYHEQLKCPFVRCQKCGNLIEHTRTKYNRRDGSQLSVSLFCFHGCEFTWRSQQKCKYLRGIGNLDLTTGIFLQVKFVTR